MKSVVLKIKGKQYWVCEGDEILIDRVKKEEKLEPQVMLLVDGDRVELGRPFVENVKVDFTVSDSFKGEKIRVFKYKAKSRYRKKRGFRPILTKICISKISV